MKRILLKQNTSLNQYGCRSFVIPNEDDIQYVIDNMLSFLEDIYPELQYANKLQLKQLNTTNANITTVSDKICIEIRPLIRRYPLPESGIDIVQKSIYKNPAYKAENFRLFSFSSEQKEKFTSYIRRLLKKKEYFCLYYSVYTFDHNILTKKKSGEEVPIYKNMISIQNAFSTQRLVCDFDNITEDDFNIYYKKLINIGLEPSYSIFSGHGYQCIFKLDKPSGDTYLLKKFTNYLLKNGFPVDPKIIDSARIMRCPFAWNCKEYSKQDYVETNTAQAIYTYVYKKTSNIFSLDDMITRISNNAILNTMASYPIKATNKTKSSKCTIDYLTPYDITSNNVSSISISPDAFQFLTTTYPMLFCEGIDSTVQKMLLGFQTGIANNMLMFLVSYLKENGYALELIIKAIETLKELNTFAYAWNDLDTEITVKRIFYTYCDSPSYFIYEKNNLNIFGDFQLSNAENSLKIHNFILDNLEYYGTTGMFIYMTMHYWNSITLQTKITIRELSNLTNRSTRTIYRDLKPFIKTSNVNLADYYLVDKSIKNRCLYKTVFHSPLEKNGFFLISYQSIDRLLELTKDKCINTTAFCIALLLKKYSFHSAQTFISQNEIARILGFKTQGTLSREIHQLESLGLLEIRQHPISPYQYKNEYILNF